MQQKSVDNSVCFEPITFVLENLRVVPETNAREHWKARARRARGQRQLTALWAKHLLTSPATLPWPLAIILTRVAPRACDGDNLQSSLKACRDGLCDFLFEAPGAGHRYDDDPRLTWHYAQRRGKVRQYAVEITLAPRGSVY